MSAQGPRSSSRAARSGRSAELEAPAAAQRFTTGTLAGVLWARRRGAAAQLTGLRRAR
ncbi:hypothetical protein ACI79G_09075 [Geodermatophilus sp. SYSU D00779]